MTSSKRNIKMQGLRAAVGATKGLIGFYGPYVQIIYNLDTGKLQAHEHNTRQSWAEHRDNRTITVCKTSDPMTMQQIADAVADAADRAKVGDSPYIS